MNIIPRIIRESYKLVCPLYYIDNKAVNLPGDYMFIKHDMGPAETFRYNDDVDDIIWNGLLVTVPKVPTGPVYDEYRQTLINYLQGPEWDNFPHLPANASLTDVRTYAGVFLTLNKNFIFYDIYIYKKDN